MNWKRGGLSVCALLLAGAPIFAAERPGWCQSGYVCVPTIEIAEDAEYHYELQLAIVDLKRRARRVGCVVGVGGGVSGVVTEDWSLNAAPAAHIGITCGLRF